MISKEQFLKIKTKLIYNKYIKVDIHFIIIHYSLNYK